MTHCYRETFREVWYIDFEFRILPGGRPEPLCLVAHELRSGRTIRIWADQLAEMKAPPFDVSDDVLICAYFVSAELSCFLALGWQIPARILDLFVEHRVLTNGYHRPCGDGLLGAMTWWGLQGIESIEKERYRQLAMRGGPYTDGERQALVDYCESDVVALRSLHEAMAGQIDLPRALLRGRSMAAVARMESVGTPIDTETLDQLLVHWDGLKCRLIREVDADYGVYLPEDRPVRFSTDRFAQWLSRSQIPWPRLPSGTLELSDDAFRSMARRYPAVAPLRELRHTLSQLRLSELQVGTDGRNRCLLSPFRATTGRNAPSTTKYIFGPSVWLRALIRASPSRALAYVDWSAQEIGIAAALSGDLAMQQAYRAGDPYLWLAKTGGFAPPCATKQTHGEIREAFKVVYLAANYGMGPQSLAQLIGKIEPEARALLRLHHEQFPKFWAWSDAAVDHAMLRGWLGTVFGWQIHVGPDSKTTSLRNFPVQATGAEMLRLACCLTTERGIDVCAPVHDALLVEGPADSIQEVVTATQDAMSEAAEIVLGGFKLRTDTKTIGPGERYLDPRGAKMWETVSRLLAELQSANPGS